MHILGPSETPSLNGCHYCYSRFLHTFPAALSVLTNPRDPSGIDSLLPAKERGRSLAFEAAPTSNMEEGAAGQMLPKARNAWEKVLRCLPTPLAGYPQDSGKARCGWAGSPPRTDMTDILNRKA